MVYTVFLEECVIFPPIWQGGFYVKLKYYLIFFVPLLYQGTSV